MKKQKRLFKIVETKGEFFIYPVPVIKEQKYLIKVESREEAEQLIHLIGRGDLGHPDEEIEGFVFVELHKDGNTRILKKSPKGTAYLLD